MANNSITFEVKVEKDGGLKVVARDAEKAAKSTEKLSDSSAKLNKSRKNHNKVEKGISQGSLASSKAFSKQAGAISGGLVPAYAVLAANVFAITAAFTALKETAAVEVLERGFTTLGNTVGRTATLMADRLKAVTGNAVSTEQALRAASAGFSAGFSIEQMESLAEIARGASVALGRDMGDALDRLIRGTAKLEPEILDELGIFVRLDDAVKDYALTLGKLPGAMTEAERRTAFLTAAIEQGQRKFASLAGTDVNPFDKMAATFNELSHSFLSIINVAIIPFLNLLSSSTSMLLGVMVLFGNTVVKMMVPALFKIGEAQREVAQKAADAVPSLKAATKEAIKLKEAAIGSAKVKIGKNSIFSQLQQKIGRGKGSPEDIKKSIASISASIKQRERVVESLKDAEKGAYLAETGHLQTLKKQHLELLALRQRGADLSGQQAGLVATSAMESNLAGTMEDIGKGGAIEGFTKAASGAKQYTVDLGAAQKVTDSFSKPTKWSKMGTAIMSGFKIAGAGARLFGAALINAIPLIGQVIFAVGLLLEAFLAWRSSSEEVATAAESLDTIIDTMPDKFEQLGVAIAASNKRIDETADAFKIQVERGYQLGQTYAVLGGVIKESAEQFNKLSISLQKTNMGLAEAVWINAVEGIYAMGRAIKEGLNKRLEAFLKTMREFGKFLTDNPIGRFIKDQFFTIKTAVEDAGAVVNETLEGISESAITTASAAKRLEAFSNVVGEFGKNAEGAKQLTSALEEVTELPNTITDAIDTLREMSKTTEGANAAQVLMQQVLSITEENVNKINTAIKGTSDVMDKGATATSEFMQSLGSKDKFQDFQAEIKALQAAIDNTRNTLTGDALATTLAKQFEDSGGAAKQFGITLEDISVKGGDAFKAVQDQLSIVVDVMLNARNEIKTLKAELTSLKMDDKIKKLNRTNTQMRTTYAVLGKLEITGAQMTKNTKDNLKDALQYADDEFEIKKQIIGLEAQLLSEQIKFRRMDKTLSDLQIAALNTQLSVIETMTNLKIKGAEAEMKAAKAAAENTGITSTKSARAKTMSEIGEAEGTGAKARVLGESLSAGTFDTDTTGMEAGEAAATQMQDARAKLTALKETLSESFEMLSTLGPEGELASAVGQSAFVISDSWMNVSAGISKGVEGMEKASLIASAVASTISQTAAVMAAASQARIAAIDGEIAAEKKRDGKSKESLAKIKGMEAKKEAMARKAFEQNKKMQMASIIASTAAGIMGIIGNETIKVGSLAFAMAALVGAMGAVQLGIVAGTSYQGGGGSAGAGVGTPSSIAVGKRNNSVDLSKSKSAGGELGYMRGESGIGGAENFRSAFYGKKSRAYGGNTGYVVGEQGPELFMPDRPGSIITADDTEEMTGSSAPIVFNISAIDASGVEDVLIEQQGNIIGMLRNAANSYGGEFLEEIDESMYTTPYARRA